MLWYGYDVRGVGYRVVCVALYDMVWCHVVWYIWCGVVWYGMVCGMVWYDMVGYGVVWYDIVSLGMVWHGMVWCGMIWYGMVWYGILWCPVVWCRVVSCWCSKIIVVWYDTVLYGTPVELPSRAPSFFASRSTLWLVDHASIAVALFRQRRVGVKMVHTPTHRTDR